MSYRVNREHVYRAVSGLINGETHARGNQGTCYPLSYDLPNGLQVTVRNGLPHHAIQALSIRARHRKGSRKYKKWDRILRRRYPAWHEDNFAPVPVQEPPVPRVGVNADPSVARLPESLLNCGSGPPNDYDFVCVWRPDQHTGEDARKGTLAQWLTRPENQSGQWLIDGGWGGPPGPVCVRWDEETHQWRNRGYWVEIDEEDRT